MHVNEYEREKTKKRIAHQRQSASMTEDADLLMLLILEESLQNAVSFSTKTSTNWASQIKKSEFNAKSEELARMPKPSLPKVMNPSVQITRFKTRKRFARPLLDKKKGASK